MVTTMNEDEEVKVYVPKVGVSLNLDIIQSIRS
jgi:hypothetical protein